MKRMTMVAMAVATFAMTQIAFASEDEANESDERGESSLSPQKSSNACKSVS